MRTVAKQLTSIAADRAASLGKCPAASGQTAVSSIIHLSESQRVESASKAASQPGSDPRLLINIFGVKRMQPVNWNEFTHGWAEGSMKCKACGELFCGVRFRYSCSDKVAGDWPKCCGELTVFCDDWKPFGASFYLQKYFQILPH
jgi:hypothetical protein